MQWNGFAFGTQTKTTWRSGLFPCPYPQCSCASCTSASSSISIPPNSTRCWFVMNCSTCGPVIFNVSRFGKRYMDRSNLSQKSPSAILGTKAGHFKHGSDCTKASAEDGGAVLHCGSSPARPSKSFWLTMPDTGLEPFWSADARSCQHLDCKVIFLLLQESALKHFVLGGFSRSTVSSLAT